MSVIEAANSGPLPGRSLAANSRKWLKANLFANWWSTVVTIVLAWLIFRALKDAFEWAILHAVWVTQDGGSAACRALMGEGACWALIGAKHRFLLFGAYPYDEQWRPALSVLLFMGLFAISVQKRFWRREIFFIWLLVLASVWTLMSGGVLGLSRVQTDSWGGLPVTLMLATVGIAAAFPLAILVALGRRSSLPAIRWLCVAYVELIRGVPLISLLFVASVIFPLFAPDGMNFDKLLRAQVAIILFAGAYLAEVIRSGIQSLPRGQYEAASALGMSYWQTTRKIILPQALVKVIPPLVNTFIAVFKDTSLVSIVGIFDLLTAGRISISDPMWQGFAIEIYFTVGLIYFVFCFAMSKYSSHLERDYATREH